MTDALRDAIVAVLDGVPVYFDPDAKPGESSRCVFCERVQQYPCAQYQHEPRCPVYRLSRAWAEEPKAIEEAI